MTDGRKRKSYQEWIQSDRPQICKQLYDEQSAQCDSPVIAKPVPGHSLDDDKYYRHSIDLAIDRLRCIYTPEYRLDQSRLGCPSENPRDPGTLAELTLSKEKGYQPNYLAIIFATAVSVFILLTTGRLFLTEAHVGWRRISLIIGSFGLMFTLIVQEDIFDNDESLLLGVAFAFPLSVLLVLGGRRIYNWVLVGFSQEQQTADPVQSTATLVAPQIIDSTVPTDPIVVQLRAKV